MKKEELEKLAEQLPDGYKILNELPLYESKKYQRIISEINIPIIWRFLSDEQYANNFFETGELQLSPYCKFKELENEIRKDETEGRIHIVGIGSNYKCESDIGYGDNAYVLCCSLTNKNILSNGISYPVSIQINDLQAFIREVTIVLNEKTSVINVKHGPCIYNDKIIKNKINDDSIHNILNASTNELNNILSNISNITNQVGGNNIFFSKPICKQEECEYRIVWLTNMKQNNSIVINVPEAIKYCSKIIYK